VNYGPRLGVDFNERAEGRSMLTGAAREARWVFLMS
jgi:hypothetical protein